jgi:hypothetical protein
MSYELRQAHHGIRQTSCPFIPSFLHSSNFLPVHLFTALFDIISQIFIETGLQM